MSKNVTLSMNKFVSQLSLAMVVDVEAAVDVVEAEEPEVDMELLLPLLAVRYQGKSVELFQDNNVKMFQDNSAAQFNE